METPRDHRCPNCVSLEQRIAVLDDQVAALQAQLAASKKNSTNSSKPPSSDIIKPPRPGGVGGRKRKRGGQPGHPRHERPPFTPEEIDEPVDYTLSIPPLIIRQPAARIDDWVQLPENCFATLVGPGINQPDSFPGYGGLVGWNSPGRLSLLKTPVLCM